jgi:hypothetical protein
MIGPAGYRSCLARSQPRPAPSDDDLLAMRRAAWRHQGVVVLRLEDVRERLQPAAPAPRQHGSDFLIAVMLRQG